VAYVQMIFVKVTQEKESVPRIAGVMSEDSIGGYKMSIVILIIASNLINLLVGLICGFGLKLIVDEKREGTK
jgi:hypothetical protein